MRKHLINILWIIVAIPFYILVLVSCLYSTFLCKTFICINEKVEVYNWLDALDSWVFKLKKKWL